MSQRVNNFKGGIQSGTTALDVDSSKLDKQLKESRDNIRVPDLKMIKQFSYEDKIKYVGDNCFGFAPDGDAGFKGDKLVAVFEAKKQGLGGNAYERWWDNACTAKHVNPDVVYVTFCSGPGSAQGQCLDNLRRKANIMLGENFKFYMSPEGFTFDQVSAIMQETLEGTL